MELFNELFGQPNQADKRLGTEHAVIIHFTYYKEDLDPLHNLDRKLEKVIEEKNVGKYDGHEINIDLSDGSLYMYGPNAENLFKAVKQTLEETDFMKGSLATLRFGPAGSNASEIEIEIEK
jgi:hypothetical protein